MSQLELSPSMSSLLRLRVYLRAYWTLCKPRVVLLMIITSVVGMLLASPQMVSLRIIVCGNLGIALLAAAAASINHVADRHLDALMQRTQRRPLVQGVLRQSQALLFAAVLSVLGFALLYCWVNPLCAILTFATLIGYAGIYTLLLKRATPQNIVIGGLAGAAPPLLGWVAVTAHIDAGALLLVLLIFVWTPPHFWALAIARKDDYARAEIPMLPVTHGVSCTKDQIVLYTFMLLCVSLLPTAFGVSGICYAVLAGSLGLRYLYWSWRLRQSDELALPMRCFRYSIVYLFALFAALLLDHFISGFANYAAYNVLAVTLRQQALTGLLVAIAVTAVAVYGYLFAACYRRKKRLTAEDALKWRRQVTEEMLWNSVPMILLAILLVSAL